MPVLYHIPRTRQEFELIPDVVHRITPIDMTPDLVTLTNVQEDLTTSAWDSEIAYKIGHEVHRTQTHLVYRAVSDHSNVQPESDTEEVYWVAVRATNFFAAFDGKLGTETVNDDEVFLQVRPQGWVTHIALFGVQAMTAQVIIRNPDDSEAYNSGQVQLNDLTGVEDFYALLTATPDFSMKHIFSGFTLEGGQRINIRLRSPGSEVRVGQIALGHADPLGIAMVDSQIGVRNFSTVDLNEFGELDGTVRKVVDTVDFRFALDARDAERAKQILSSRLSLPTIYTDSLTDQSRGTMIMGIASLDKADLDGSGATQMRLSVKGIT